MKTAKLQIGSMGIALAVVLSACGSSAASPASTSASPPASVSASQAVSASHASGATSPSASAASAASNPSALSSSAAANPSASSSSAASLNAAGASAGAVASGQMIPLAVSYSAIIGNELPVWVAHDAGFFKKNGLDVSLKYIHSSKGIAALLSGGVQVADIGGAETLSAVAGGADLMTIAVDAPVYPFQLMAEPSIKTVQDLKGKKIGVSEPGSSSDIATVVALKKVGLNPSTDVSILPVGSASARITALLNGAIQAGLSFPPDNLVLEQKGFHVLLDLTSLNLPAAISTSVLKRSYLDAHRDVAQKYVDSLVEAVAWAKQHKSETVKILEKYYKQNNQHAMDATYDFFMGKVVPALPYPKADMYQNAISVLSAKNAKVKNFDMSKMIDASFVQKAASEGLDKKATA